MRVVSRVDADGTFLGDVLLREGEPAPPDTVEGRPGEGFHRPRWDGSKWVEGKPSAEILTDLKAAKKRELEAAYARETAQSFGGGPDWVAILIAVLATDIRDARVAELKTRLTKLQQKQTDADNATTVAGDAGVEAITW